MAVEIEAKLRVDSFDAVRAELSRCNAEQLGVVIESNSILDDPSDSLYSKGCGLRVRHAASQVGGVDRATMTFKGPRQAGKLKLREEHEVVVDDASTALQLLRGLGFVVFLQYEKKRESWKIDDCLVELDEPARLGCFIEVEGPSESAVESVIKKLGLEGLPHVPESYVSMAMRFCQENGIKPAVLPL